MISGFFSVFGYPGSRDFSCLVSGFGQVFASPLVGSTFGRKSVLAAREKEPLIPRVALGAKTL